MNFEIKRFNELNVDEMYEIAKSRFEVFVCMNRKQSKSRILMIRIRIAII